jgi:hypothetical protein
MITIKSKTSYFEIEELYKNISSSDSQILRLPTHLELGGAFGLPVAIIQLIADWATKQENSTLRLYSSFDDEKQLESFAGTPHGMASLYFSSISQGINKEELPSKKLWSFILPYVEAMQTSKYINTMQGRGAFLCCFASARNEFLIPLYKSPKQEILRSRDEFSVLIRQILDKVAPEANRRLATNDVTNVSQLIYELFSNTHRHARTDLNGNLIRKGVRGIYIKFIHKGYSGTREANFTSSDANLNRYLARAMTEAPQSKASHNDIKLANSFLEISVFDTGPGLAKRWLAKNSVEGANIELNNLSIDDEYALIRECFISGQTSTNEYGRGEGLSNVLSSLSTLKAFLRLRTGRLCLEQDFIHKDNNFAFAHWQPKQPELVEVIGARYTAIIPLGVNRT